MKKGLMIAALVATLLWVPCNYASAADIHTISPEAASLLAIPGNTIIEYFPLAMTFAPFTWVLAISDLQGATRDVTVQSVFFSGSSTGGSVNPVVPALGTALVTPPSGSAENVVPCPSLGCQLYVYRSPVSFISFFSTLVQINESSGAFSVVTPYIFGNP